MIELAATPIYNIYVSELTDKSRTGEKATVGEMIARLFDGAGLSHTDSGAPFVAGSDRHISVSHGGGYAVVAVSDRNIGVDIEAPRAQLEKVRRKFMREDDEAESLLHAWTAKEAAFKAAGNSCLTIHDITVKPTEALIPGLGSFAINYYGFEKNLIAITYKKD